MTPKKTLVGVAVLATLALGGTADIVPSRPTGAFDTVQKAESQRRYLQEREDYITANGDRLKVPKEAQAKAGVGKDLFEERLIQDGFIKNKGAKITEPKKSLIEVAGEQLSSVDWIDKAYAFTFGKEDFESCGSIPCSFDVNNSYNTGNFALDTTSKVAGVNSARCDINAPNDGCVISKNLTSSGTYYMQFKILLPTGWTVGASGYLALFAAGDGVGAPVYCNLEDYGSVRITCAGDELGYTDTGINVPINSATTLEFKIVISALTGELNVYKNNSTEASPDFSTGLLVNTGVQNITLLTLGGYHPDTNNDKYYDDVYADTVFVGSGTPPSVSYTTSILSGGGNIKGGIIVK